MQTIYPDSRNLPDNTYKVLQLMSQAPLPQGGVLIGGTALAIHVGHRMSEDLDFAFPHHKLPRKDIMKTLRHLKSMGCKIINATDEDTQMYWENEGSDIEDYHQDWNVDGVKVTFFAADTGKREDFLQNNISGYIGSIPVLSKEALFDLKSGVLTKRINSRDGFDLLYYLEHEGKTIGDIFAAAQNENEFYGEDQLYKRLAPSAYSKLDPGFMPSAGSAELNLPQTIDELIQALQGHIDIYQQELTMAFLAK
ncbi:MAG: hypothetical protein COB46_12380 [Rhodospirillaceae bacterium]|nr:MAG: hypothetical protein COB46_12380 [Rhodospirillaceae bacterium]